MIPIDEWTPDLPPLEGGATRAVNALPRGKGYAPFYGPVTYTTNALDAYPRGVVTGRSRTDALYTYAATATKIYEMSGATFTDVTALAGDYTTGTEENWDMAHWRESIYATNFADAPQAITLGAANFAALAGTPPKARQLAVVRQFLVLGNIDDTSDGLVPNRIHWSGIGDPTTWTPSTTTQAGRDDLERGGWVHRIFGGEYGLVFCENAVWRMSYAGPPIVWQLDEVESARGLIAPSAAAEIGNRIYYLAPDGFRVLTDGSTSEPIGRDRVDEYVLADMDAGYKHRIRCTVDPERNVVYWCYMSTNHGGRPDKWVAFDYTLNRWSEIETDVDYPFAAQDDELTLEQIDNINVDVDQIETSLDFFTSDVPALGGFNSDHKMVVMAGAQYDATMETGEVSLIPGRRARVTRCRPVVDGGTTTLQLGTRNTTSDETVTWSNAYSERTDGSFAPRKAARYHRFRLNVSGDWSHVQGLEAEEFEDAGSR